MSNIGARRKRQTPRPRVVVPVESPHRITKELAPCCTMQRDDLGRLPIGFCGPLCIRRAMRQGETYRRALATWVDAVGPIEVAL